VQIFEELPEGEKTGGRERRGGSHLGNCVVLSSLHVPPLYIAEEEGCDRPWLGGGGGAAGGLGGPHGSQP
jgi:hypothetical protein